MQNFLSKTLRNAISSTSNNEKTAPKQAMWELPPPNPPKSKNPPRILIIGAGSRGGSFGRAIYSSTNGCVAAVAEPIDFKRKAFGSKHIWGFEEPREGEEFTGWKEFIEWELQRRERAKNGEEVPEGVDGVFVCTLDELHAEIITELAPLNLHVLCEKPLAGGLQDCLQIYKSLRPEGPASPSPALFGVGHVLRYSPHNILLRKLLLEDEAIGEIISIEHTEPVGWWHFSHSYVRGNWRKESTSAPSLLTKSCHDIDLIMWLLCSPPDGLDRPPHLPSKVTSSGSLLYFKPSRKPELAGNATNCLSCPAEKECQYSAKKIYYDLGLNSSITSWPVNIVVPDIEECNSFEAAEKKLMQRLGEDYTAGMSQADINSRSWYGRCVYEAGNDVCDDQTVTITWEDETLPETNAGGSHLGHKVRHAKTAVFHMVAFTEKICERRSRIYGTKGELETDSSIIKIYDFASGETKTHRPHLAGGGHGGGDYGLARQFVLAIDAVKNHEMSVDEAQRTFVGCTLEDVIRSHAMVFAAEDARKGSKVIDWAEWWDKEVGGSL
ncbi:hypothetical protein FGG08_004124 [Glutinoglossum americanum]|uniref:Gfo/Idh/MocA-like oxidoreductase N-terminal domain-containing protein n=1 Tax=Glutinoglossum americanum TaxID=1670608 RepID=A0A9P8L321_9PEZI|nr:hypothetical protein FGG08_004124 [Glutinoglossum americanum]